MRLFPACLVLALISSPAFATEAGTVTRLRGEATAGSHPLAEAAKIAVGEQIHTGSGARLQVKLVDGTDLTLGEKADFTIDELVIGADQGSALFRLGGGAFRMIAGAISKKPNHRVEVATAFATIGIRGTDVWGGSLEKPLDVFLVEGVVEVTTPGGRVVLDKPGQGTSVTAPGAMPVPAHPWPPGLQKRAFATVSFEAR